MVRKTDISLLVNIMSFSGQVVGSMYSVLWNDSQQYFLSFKNNLLRNYSVPRYIWHQEHKNKDDADPDVVYNLMGISRLRGIIRKQLEWCSNRRMQIKKKKKNYEYA